jgi:hypothetical protein
VYDFIKDITYLLKPVFGLLIGYQACKSVSINPLRLAVLCGVFISIVHLYIVAFAIVYYGVRNINDLREHAGYFSDYEVYIVVILIFYKELGLEMSRKWIRIFIIIVGLSSALYMARTNFIQFAILYMALRGYLRPTPRAIKLVVSLVVFSLVSYSIIYSSNPKRGGKGLEGFFYKIKIAPLEPFKTHVDKDNWIDFNDNYRSYENILTIRQMTQAGPITVLTGKGLGSTIDLKRTVWLQTSYMRYIPFLHNGFMTVFLKSGLLGVCIYIGSILVFFRQKYSSVARIQYFNRLLIGTGVFLFISNWVFLGFYNLFDTKTILMGLLFAHIEQLKKYSVE